MKKYLSLIIFILMSLILFNGCSVSLYSRKTFAEQSLNQYQLIYSEYAKYVNNDPTLNDQKKKRRLGMAKQFENFLKEGATE